MTLRSRSLVPGFVFALVLSSCRCSEPTPVADGGQPVVTAGGAASPASCAADQLNCDGRCVDPQSSVTSCGACGRACSAAANTSAVCASGRCATACLTGFLDCDGDTENGCEADTRTSVTSCGRCGRVCPAPMGMSASCTAGQCGVCPMGQSACGAACVDTQTSSLHCGACGTSCGPLRCVAGACAAPPTLTAAVPARVFGARRTEVRLQGTNFRAGVAVRFNGSPASVLNVAPTELTVRAPHLGLDAGPVRVEVLNDDGLGVISTSVLTVRAVTTSFAAPTTQVVGSAIFHVAALDIDADGRVDLMGPRPTSSSVDVIRNAPSGLSTVSSVITSVPSFFPASGDFNGDGRMDVAVAARDDGRLSVLLNSGVGFNTTTLTLPGPAAGVVVADLDANGTLDLVVGSRTTNGLMVLAGAGDGTFAVQSPVQTLTPTAWPFLGRVGMDQRLTVAGAMVGGGLVVARALLTTSPDVSTAPLRESAARAAGLADLDDDGSPDLVACSVAGGALVSFGVSTTGPNATQLLSQSVGAPSNWLAVGDLNADQAPDLVVAGPGGRLVVYPNEGGRFTRETLLATGTHESVTLADLDGDGLLDLVVPQGLANSILIFRNQSTVGP